MKRLHSHTIISYRQEAHSLRQTKGAITMNAQETALKLYPEMPIPTGLLADLLKASQTEDLTSVLVAAYKLGYQRSQEE